MNAKHAILVDVDKCIGCYTCAVGCHQWHEADGNTNKMLEVYKVGPVEVDGKMKTDYFVKMTENCEIGKCCETNQPLCVEFCPVNALTYCNQKEMLSLLGGDGRYQVSAVE